MYLGDATWPEAGDRLADCPLALVPLGSTDIVPWNCRW